MGGYVGIDLGGTNIKAVVIEEAGCVVLERSIPTYAHEGVEAVISRMADLIQDLVQSYSLLVEVVGVTAPAVVNMETGTVEMIPNMHHSWTRVPLASELARRCGQSVYLLNDARAATYAESQFGAGKDFKDFIFIGLGTGVGGGVVHQGTLFLGSRGVAGEVGHIVVVPDGLRCGCGNRGCLETVASGPATVTAAARYVRQGIPTRLTELCGGDISRITPELVDKAAQLGDPAAIEIFETVSNYLFSAITSVASVLNPEAVIIGGGVGKSQILTNMLRKRVEEDLCLFPKELGGMQVLSAKFDEWAGAVGAAAWAIRSHEMDRYHQV